MVGVPSFVAPSGVPVEPLDVRDPEVLRALADAVAILGPDFRPRLMLGDLGRRAGFVRADDLSTRLADWVHGDDHPALADALTQCAATPGSSIDATARVHNDVDGWHAMTLSFCNLLDHPDVQGIIVRAVDQTVFEREARWRSLVGESPIGIYEQDLDGRCTFVNAAFARILGLEPQDALGFGWTKVIEPEDLATMRALQDASMRHGDRRAIEVRLAGPSENARWVSARSVPLRDVDGTMTGYLGTLEDVTDRKRLEERLEFDATHDRLTGLGSRSLLVAELSAALARVRRGRHAVALLFIDLDGFKRVNDMLGHAAGDELLMQVAHRLEQHVRDGDTCVRLGGDEFVVCCPSLDSADRVDGLAARLLAVVSEPYDVHGHEVVVGASIGIATAQGEDPVSVDQLLSNADLAAYRAKRHGRGRVEVFDDELRKKLATSRRIARSVATLLDEPRVPLVGSPIVSLASGAVVGFDCAIDWEAAGLAGVEGIERVVEETGMSRALDVALVRTMLAQLGEWERTPPGPIVPGLGVVLTRTGALSTATAEMLAEQLGHADASRSLCWIGIPESAVAQDLASSTAVVRDLTALGLGVALCNFGSSVSSLDQLRRLPTPTISIDASLVVERDGPDEAAREALLRAIVQYAKALGRVVMVNGVRDARHAARLRDLGCDLGAGPAFGEPVRPDQVRPLLTGRSAGG